MRLFTFFSTPSEGPVPTFQLVACVDEDEARQQATLHLRRSPQYGAVEVVDSAGPTFQVTSPLSGVSGDV